MGVQTLAFNEDYVLLFSSGFDHEIIIWNPYIGDHTEKGNEITEKQKTLPYMKRTTMTDAEESKAKRKSPDVNYQQPRIIKA